MNTLIVRLEKRSYPLKFGPLIPGFPAALRQLAIRPSQILIITSRAVRKAGYAQRLMSGLKKSGLTARLAVIPNGEAHKNLKTVERLYETGLKAGLDRTSLVIGLGGGVVTDLAGFFAATYMRGLAFASVPTTLLGMVDAAIGGKTGVDLKQGKNLVGAFWQPRLVWIDPQVLGTLPAREWRTGFAEVIKYGVIKSRPFFEWLERKFKSEPDPRQWPKQDLAKAIYESAKTKADVVSRDERERPLKGGREILNFGHTFGHALEAATVYARLTHGEAISIGMVAAGEMALGMRMWNSKDQERLISLFRLLKLPVSTPTLTNREKDLFWKTIRKDKKHVSGRLRFVLPVRMGRVLVKNGVSIAQVKKALRRI